MDKKNVIIILLVILIGIVSEVGLLIGVKSAINDSIIPLRAKLNEIESRIQQKDIQGNKKALADIQGQLRQIQNKISHLNANGGPQGPQEPPEDTNKVYDLPVGVSSILGNPNAPVTITEFSDFQCPFCSHFYSAIKDVLGAYPDKVRVVIKNFPLPFHPNARPAAKLAMAANEQGKFQGMMEALLANGGDVSDDKVKGYAKSLGLDYNKLMADDKNQDARWEKQIKDDMQLADQSDVRGTPTFFLNGRKTFSRDLGGFKAQIDPILAEKK